VSLNKISWKLPPALSAAIDASFADWKNNDKVARLWKKDASLWSGTDESNWLGWLTITEQQLANLATFKKLAQEVKKAKFRHVLLLGMGGSSLCPEVLRLTFGKIPGSPELHVLDSTDPGQIKALERKLDLSSNTFLNESTPRSAPKKLAATSSPSPIPAPRCKRSPKRTISATSSPAYRASAGAIPHSRISALCPVRAWGWTSANF
jgi:hypothetical protein